MDDNQTGILLEVGTNEMELMEFTIGGEAFGINVAKVREILMPSPVKALPHAHPAVEGVFKPRDTVLTVIDLPKYLDIYTNTDQERSLFIVTSFNQTNIAFRVHTVEGINRISWENIQKPDNTVYGGADGVTTGLASYEDKLITILDFEKIIADIAPSSSIQMSEVDQFANRESNSKPLMVVEDSVFLSNMIRECLAKSGYDNIFYFSNGQEAWDHLTEIKANKSLQNQIACIITDIEMPMMDGHRLTKLVKDDEVLKKIPLIIFSSLIDERMRIKGESLGADAQLSKPEIGHLVTLVDQLTANFDENTLIK